MMNFGGLDTFFKKSTNRIPLILAIICINQPSENSIRPTSLLWKNWVEESGADFCVKQVAGLTSAKGLGWFGLVVYRCHL